MIKCNFIVSIYGFIPECMGEDEAQQMIASYFAAVLEDGEIEFVDLEVDLCDVADLLEEETSDEPSK